MGFFRGREITCQEIVTAMENFDRLCLNPDDYDRWREKGNYDYAIRYQNRLYPPKIILSMARGIPYHNFSGGIQTYNRVFSRQGFEIINKP